MRVRCQQGTKERTLEEQPRRPRRWGRTGGARRAPWWGCEGPHPALGMELDDFRLVPEPGPTVHTQVSGWLSGHPCRGGGTSGSLQNGICVPEQWKPLWLGHWAPTPILLPMQEMPSSASTVPWSQKQMTLRLSGSMWHSSTSQWLQFR